MNETQKATPTNELLFVEKHVTRDNEPRRINILNQKWVREDGTYFWREIGKVREEDLKRQQLNDNLRQSEAT